MKTLKSCFAVFILLISISNRMMAQNAPATGKDSAPKNETQAVSPKEIWKKDYAEIKPKLDHYLAKAKEIGNNHPDVSQQVKTLDQMVRDFRLKIDQWDNASKEERENYSRTMNAYYQRIRAAAQNVQESIDNIK